MAGTLEKGALFPEVLTNEMINLVRGKSSLARLSGTTPVSFNGDKIFTFNLDKEVDIVAESGAKSNGGATVGYKTIQPIKIEYGFRVSDEFMYSSEEARLDILRNFVEGYANKVARGLDIMAFHGLNPRSKQAATGTIGNNHFDAQVDQFVSYNASTPDANVEEAIALVQANEHDVTGMAMSPAFRTALASLRKGANLNEPLFPELAWGSNPGVLNGLPVDTNSTVSFNSGDDRAILGNFRDFFRWGYAKQIPMEVIQYGNPDNDADAGDLKGHNQVYLRCETYIGWGILVPDAFAIVTAGSIPSV